MKKKLALLATAGLASLGATPTPTTAQLSTTFTMPSPVVPCTQGSTMVISADVANRGALPFDGKIESDPGGSSSPLQIAPGASTKAYTKIGFNCERTPLLATYRANIKDGNGVVVAQKGYKVGSFAYSQVNARPPAAGSGVKNVMFFTGVSVLSAKCRQPIEVRFDGVNLLDSQVNMNLYAQVDYPGAPEKSVSLILQPRIAPGTFTSVVTGSALDCTAGAPTITPKAIWGTSSITSPIQGAVVGTPQLHAESANWVDESTQDPSMGHQ